jgi:S1-C subfamily serine protease
VVAAPQAANDRPARVIARSLLDRELSDFQGLSDQASVAQLSAGGFRLSRLRSGSFVERMGLRVGDIILRVDGRPINSADDASAAYAWLRVTDHFTVELVRDGRPITLRYVISPSV